MSTILGDAVTVVVDGGGGSSGAFEFSTQGSFTPVSDTASITINIGRSDNFDCMVIQQKTIQTDETQARKRFIKGVLQQYTYTQYDGTVLTDNLSAGTGFPSYNNGAARLTGTNFAYTQSGDSITITVPSEYPFKSGIEYVWGAVFSNENV